MTTDTLLRAAWAAWATWACKRRKPPHVRPTQVGLKGPGGRLPGLFLYGCGRRRVRVRLRSAPVGCLAAPVTLRRAPTGDGLRETRCPARPSRAIDSRACWRIGIGMLAGRNRNLRPLRRGRRHGRAGCCDAGAKGVGMGSRGRLAPPRRQRGGASRARSATSRERGGYRECCRPDQPGSWADRAASGGGHRYPSSRCAVDERGWSPAVGSLKVLSALPKAPIVR
jgi:hypothetical protein